MQATYLARLSLLGFDQPQPLVMQQHLVSSNLKYQHQQTGPDKVSGQVMKLYGHKLAGHLQPVPAGNSIPDPNFQLDGSFL